MTPRKASSAAVIRFPTVADPTIEGVCRRFLDDQARRLKPRTLSRYKDVVQLLQHYFDDYAYEALDRNDAALFKRYCNAAGPEQRKFCQIFGPDKIAESIGGFLGWFLTKKVIASDDLLRTAGTVTRKLSQWLEQQGMIDPSVADDVAEAGAAAARDLPKAERAARLLAEHAAKAGRDPRAFADEDYLEFGHFDIVKLEPRRLWLTSSLEDDGCGPISIPSQASQLLQQGWEISCSLGRARGRWHIVEMGNVYPR